MKALTREAIFAATRSAIALFRSLSPPPYDQGTVGESCDTPCCAWGWIRNILREQGFEVSDHPTSAELSESLGESGYLAMCSLCYNWPEWNEDRWPFIALRIPHYLAAVAMEAWLDGEPYPWNRAKAHYLETLPNKEPTK